MIDYILTSTVEGNWFEFGFAGAVTGVLLTATFTVVRWALNFASHLQSSHTTEREEWREEAKQIRDEHRLERNAWTTGLDRVSDGCHGHLEDVRKSLTTAIYNAKCDKRD